MAALPSTVAAVVPIHSAPALTSNQKPRRTLFNINEDFAAMDELLDECEGEITGVEEIINKWFAELGQDVREKADGYAAFIMELEARAKARNEESDRLKHRAKIDENTASWLRSRLKDFMESRAIPRLETRRFKIGVQTNGGVQPLHIKAPLVAKSIPEFQRITIDINNDAIRKALESDDSELREKAELVAEFQPRGTQLRIR